MQFAVLSSLIGAAMAGMEHMQVDFDVYFKNITGQDRAFTGALGNSIATMNEMGCWCYFDDDVGRGHGQPIDTLDQLCKNLGNCYECTIFDGEASGEICDEPWTVDYNSGLGSGKDLYDDCKENNPSDDGGLGLCAARTCSCEGTFVEGLLVFFIGGGQIVPGNKHSNGFDSDGATGECIVSRSANGGESDCCGAYPSRKGYKKFGGERNCCGERVFSNVAGMQCCDASISKIGFTC